MRDEGVVVEYTRLDSNGQQVTVEKPNVNLKIAEVAERSMVALLSKLGLSPKDRQLVKPTSVVRTGKEQSEAERLDAEIARLEAQAQESTADPAVEEEDLHSDIDIVDEPQQTEAQKLMAEAERALSEEI